MASASQAGGAPMHPAPVVQIILPSRGSCCPSMVTSERLSWQILELDEATIDVSLTTGMSPTTSLSMKLAVTPPTH